MKRLFPLLLSLCLLMGCGGSYDSTTDSVMNNISSSDVVSGFDSYGNIGGVTESYNTSTNISTESDTSIDTSTEPEAISKDMLVYRGSIDLTTKQYDDAITGLDTLFHSYDCFIESSREYTNTHYDDETPLRTFTATIRVASKDYDTMMNGISNLGVISDKRSSVENLNVEYSDITTALRIYRAREERYLKLLEQCENESDAIAIEDKLTELSIAIAQYESRKSVIETDVAYSYIDIEISEVKEYSTQIKHTDNFFIRLGKEIANTFFGFINFLEEFVFLIVRISPYAALAFLIFIIVKKTKLGNAIKKIWTKY